MKKVWVWILSIAMVLAAAAGAESAEGPSFAALAGYDWSFSSGAGAWSTDLQIREDGSFTGTYHDSEMGETGDDFPDGTVYGCSFSGQLSLVDQVDENTWKIRVDRLAPDEGQVKEAIEDGIRYVTTDIYGLSEGDEMLLYRPGTPVSVLSEDMQYWAHIMDRETPSDELENWFLSSEANSSGFVAYPVIGMANPWEDLTAEQLNAASGLAFGMPENAENVIYRYLGSEHLAEMQFTIGADTFCARIQPAAAQDGELPDISGMYYTWENEEAVSVGSCSGTIAQAQGDGYTAELCRWYDAAPGLAYSLSVITADPDGLDLAAVAEQVYIPMQGDA